MKTTATIILILIFSPAVFADHSVASEKPDISKSPCPLSFAMLGKKFHLRPQAILHTKDIKLEKKVLDFRRIRESAIHLNLNKGSGKRLASLPNGNYVYAVDSKDNLVIIPRALDPGRSLDLHSPNVSYVGSHEGIVNYLRFVLRDEPEVLAAGEITIRNGRVMMVSNGSGSYKGKTENLIFGIGRLKFQGLKISKQTELRDFATAIYPDPHKLAQGQALADIEASRDPGFPALQKSFRRVMAKVAAKFPGEMDANIAVMDMADREKQGFTMQALMLFSKWLKPEEGEAFIIRDSLETIGQAPTLQLLDSLEHLADSAPKPAKQIQAAP